jgi:UDP-N-acetyl-D-mannosaminuronic acid dehydrogenase
MTGRSVCVIGLGYIGLPTAGLLASRGWQVIGVDTNPDVVSAVSRGIAHISEPEIDALVHETVRMGSLRAAAAPEPAEVTLICVPTPFVEGTTPPAPDVTYVEAAVRSTAPTLRPGDLLIIESTCPVGTTERLASLLQELTPIGSEVLMAYCPERVLPGRILSELVANDRVVGGINEESSVAAEAFYRSVVEGEILRTDSRTAEMVKLVENSYRDVNIAFANEISIICEHLGIDPWQLISLANHHPRVNVLQPGPGVGGHCIAVDPWFIVANDPATARLIRTARTVNDEKTDWVVEQIAAAADVAGNHERPPRIACLGLAYKPDIDDLRESPALRVARTLKRRGFDVLAVEPNISEHAEFALHTMDEAVSAADVVAILVAHREFADLEVGDRVVLDFCGLLAAGRGSPPRVGVRAATT